ncbi:hypothetical protein JOD54_001079 [Actinokineospora baliensis]|uniref:hypothetical protein n=1 Tax=Actinokineospora baliensis TaxID=547056 RepID=UPI00195C7711|nr:hypothetical protein [Actinokineospora baliensis]MBM7770875.1 hypothetical protein [Actinokineospora baliensis]
MTRHRPFYLEAVALEFIRSALTLTIPRLADKLEMRPHALRLLLEEADIEYPAWPHFLGLGAGLAQALSSRYEMGFSVSEIHRMTGLPYLTVREHLRTEGVYPK